MKIYTHKAIEDAGIANLKHTPINKLINKFPELKKLIDNVGEKIRGILEQVIYGGINIKVATQGLTFRTVLSVAIVLIAVTKLKSQTTTTRGQNELNVIEFHSLTDPSCTALGLADNQEKLTTHAILTQNYLNATDTRLIDMAPFCRVDQETTTAIVGSGNKYTDINNLNTYISNSANNCNISDIQYFYTNIPGYEEWSYIGEAANGFCRAAFSGSYDAATDGSHAVGHVSGAVNSTHDNGPRYNATYTYDMTAVGGGVSTMTNGKTIGASDNSGGSYQPFYSTPEAYNKDTPANGGDGLHYYNSIPDEFPAWIATDQMNNNTGYTETTTGIYNFLVANPEKIQEEAVAPPDTPVAVQTGDNSIGTSTTYDVEYPNTTSSAYQGVYFTNEIATIYLYDVNNSGDGQFLYGPKNPDEDFDNLPAGTYVIRTYFQWSNGISSVSNPITITGPDTEDPVAVCQDATVQLDANGQAAITQDMIDNGSTDNVGIVSYTVTPNTVDCDDLGNITVTLTVEDAAGNTSSCNATVMVEDLLGPNANAQSTTAYLDANGNVVIDPNDVNNNSTDNCSIVNMSVNPANFSCSGVGVQSVTFTVTDGSGNSNSTNTTVNIEDNLDPIIQTQNLTLELDANGEVSTTAAAVDNGTNDNCGVASTSISQENFTCDDLGTNTIVFTATDVNGNTTNGNVQITIVDNINPVAVPQDLVVELDEDGNASITAAQANDGSSDNCEITNMSVNPENFACSDIGANTVVLTVTDNSGNSHTTNFNVNVEDNLAPVAIGQNLTLNLDGNSSVTTTAEAVNNGSSDNCEIADMTLSQYAFTEEGIFDVDFTVIDGEGNSTTITVQITVVDSEDSNPPTAICQNASVNLDANGEATITTDMIDNGSWDEEGDVTLSISPTSADCSDLGNIIVTLTVTDGGGNTDECTSTLSVNDIAAPTMQAQNITIDLAETAPSPYIIYPVDVDNGSSDNCSFTMGVSPSSFEHTGVYDVILSGEDESGNTSETSLQVTAIRSVGISESENTAGVYIYPNPTSGIVRIETAQAIEQIRIYNLIGQLVYENMPHIDGNKNQIEIQTENWIPSIYTVNTRTTTGVQKTIKLIVR